MHSSDREPTVRLPAKRKNRKRRMALWAVGAFLGPGILGSLGDPRLRTPPGRDGDGVGCAGD